MTEGQALDYFNAALKHGSLCAGTNYMIDRDDTVWECTVWAGGGIWDVKPNKRENTKSYHELRMFAATQRRTTFEERTDTPNAKVSGAGTAFAGLPGSAARNHEARKQNDQT